MTLVETRLKLATDVTPATRTQGARSRAKRPVGDPFDHCKSYKGLALGVLDWQREGEAVCTLYNVGNLA